MDLVSAARQAASAYAAGEEPTGPDPLVGRSFAVRIAFGCEGPASAQSGDGRTEGVAQWSWGADSKTIELKLTPADWTSSNLIAQDEASPVWEAVEGFWLPRPWMESEACPAVRSEPLQIAEPAAAAQTLGLAAVFETGGSRVGRRDGRAYVSTLRPKGNAPVSPPEDGFRLVLEGRLVSFPNGQAIRCQASGPDERPLCLAAAKLHRVAFENPHGGEVISEWRPG